MIECKVEVVEIPGEAKQIVLNGTPETRTAKACLGIAGIETTTGKTVTLNGTVITDLEHKVEDGDTVIVTEKHVGN